MKNMLLPLVLLGVLMLSACEKEQVEPVEKEVAPELALEMRSLDGVEEIDFFVQGKTSGAENPVDDSNCLPDFPLADQRGKGVMPTYGPVDIRFTFCVDPTGIPQGAIDYFNAKATFTLANGDELYAEGEGTVIINNPDANPKAFFKDKFYFTGAKVDGEMKPASGFFMTDSKVFNIFTPREFTRHKLTGELKIGE